MTTNKELLPAQKYLLTTNTLQSTKLTLFPFYSLTRSIYLHYNIYSFCLLFYFSFYYSYIILYFLDTMLYFMNMFFKQQISQSCLQTWMFGDWVGLVFVPRMQDRLSCRVNWGAGLGQARGWGVFGVGRDCECRLWGYVWGFQLFCQVFDDIVIEIFRKYQHHIHLYIISDNLSTNHNLIQNNKIYSVKVPHYLNT